MSTPKAGLFHRLRIRFLGERDAVEQRLESMAKEGSSVARIAHTVSLLMVLCFSAGSLVALSGEALAAFLVQWQRGTVNVPAAISIAVSFLLVLCMDTGMIYAGLRLRLLSSRRASLREKRLDLFVMAGVAVVESGTYLYMSALYEHPTAIAAWALIGARSISAPLLAIYLTLARSVPVTPGDILYQAELASGMTVLREIAERSADSSIPLSRKLELFKAAALMTAEDKARLDDMIAAVEMTNYRLPSGMRPPDGGPGSGERLPELDDPSVVEADPESPTATAKLRIVRPRRRRKSASGNGSGHRTGMTAAEKREIAAFAFLDAKPEMRQWELQELLHCRPTTARSIMAKKRIRDRERA